MKKIGNKNITRLLEHTSNIISRYKDNEKITLKEYGRIYQDSCSILRKLLETGMLEEAIFTYDKFLTLPESKRRARRVIEETGSLLEFLKFEEDIFSRCGMEPQKAEVITEAISDFITNVESNTSIDTHRIWSDVQNLTNEICSISRSVNQTEKMILDEHLRNRTLASFLGSSVIVTNTLILVGGGTLGSYAGISVSIGISILDSSRERKYIFK